MEATCPIGSRLSRSRVVADECSASILMCRGLFGFAGACPFLMRFCWRVNSMAAKSRVIPRMPKTADSGRWTVISEQYPVISPEAAKMIVGSQIVGEMNSILRTATSPIEFIMRFPSPLTPLPSGERNTHALYLQQLSHFLQAYAAKFRVPD